jgi:hypothetical protein
VSSGTVVLVNTDTKPNGHVTSLAYQTEVKNKSNPIIELDKPFDSRRLRLLDIKTIDT